MSESVRHRRTYVDVRSMTHSDAVRPEPCPFSPGRQRATHEVNAGPFGAHRRGGRITHRRLLTPASAAARPDSQLRAAEVASALVADLGDSSAGSYLDASGALVVNVTDAAAAERVRAGRRDPEAGGPLRRPARRGHRPNSAARRASPARPGPSTRSATRSWSPSTARSPAPGSTSSTRSSRASATPYGSSTSPACSPSTSPAATPSTAAAPAARSASTSATAPARTTS